MIRTPASAYAIPHASLRHIAWARKGPCHHAMSVEVGSLRGLISKDPRLHPFTILSNPHAESEPEK